MLNFYLKIGFKGRFSKNPLIQVIDFSYFFFLRCIVLDFTLILPLSTSLFTIGNYNWSHKERHQTKSFYKTF